MRPDLQIDVTTTLGEASRNDLVERMSRVLPTFTS